jgi:hypothetical protein
MESQRIVGQIANLRPIVNRPFSLPQTTAKLCTSKQTQNALCLQHRFNISRTKIRLPGLGGWLYPIRFLLPRLQLSYYHSRTTAVVLQEPPLGLGILQHQLSTGTNGIPAACRFAGAGGGPPGSPFRVIAAVITVSDL